MPATIIALDHLDPFYRDLIRAEASDRGIELVNLPSQLTPGPDSRNVALAIQQLDAFGSAGADRFRRLRKLLGRVPVVVMVQESSQAIVDQLAHLGPEDVVELPADPGHVVERCFERLPRPAKEQLPEIVGSSPAMAQLRQGILDVARNRCNVLLTGSTGTGKGVAARAIHRLSSDRNRQFVHADCASLSRSLIESELFGHERGSFTGAIGSRAGRFELAADGVIFLDEIGELEPSLQAKFLRVLEDRVFERVGGVTTLPMRARVIAATSRDLVAEVEDGTFRPDLYYRLRVVNLHVPDLATRASDIPELIESRVDSLCETLGLPEATISEGAMERLMIHPWPGNVRELMNVLEAMLVRAGGREISVEDVVSALPRRECSWDTESVSGVVPTLPGLMASGGIDANERAQIVEQLYRTGGNVARAARRMKVARSTLRYRIRLYGLSEHVPRD